MSAKKFADVLLEGGALDDAGVADGDAAFPVDEQGKRHRFQVEAIAEGLVADDDGVLHAFLLGKGADQLRAAVVHGDTDDGEAVLPVLPVEVDVPGQLDLAAAAPGSPEVEQDDLATEARESDGLAVEVGESEVGGGLSVDWGDEGVGRARGWVGGDVSLGTSGVLVSRGAEKGHEKQGGEASAMRGVSVHV